MAEEVLPVDKYYPSGEAFIRDIAGSVFLALETNSFVEVGKQLGLSKYYKSDGSIRTAVNRAYNTVLDDPLKWNITIEKAKEIQGIVQSRGLGSVARRENKEAQVLDISTLITTNRDKAAGLIRKKLDYLDRNPKALAEMSLRDLVGALHILFDKGQIIAGQATEHIAVMTNLPDNMSPEDALKMVTRMRQANELEKTKYE